MGKPYITRQCSLPEAGVPFPLKEHYEKINAELFDPRITTEDYEPSEEAQKARAPSFDDNAEIPEPKEEVKHGEQETQPKAEQDVGAAS